MDSNKTSGNGAGAPTGGKHDSVVAVKTLAMSLSTWDLERNLQTRKDTPRSRLILLRSHKRLRAALEAEQDLAPPDCSLLEIQDNAQVACLLLHDELGSPADLNNLARFLHQGGLTVYAPLLSGRGGLARGTGSVLWQACYQQARQCFRLLKRTSRHVHVVGLGFGAALAIHLARREPVASLALLAPALVPRVSLIERLFFRMKLHRLPWLRPRLDWQPEILAAMETARGQISRLRVPIYASQCEDDERISPVSLRLLQKRARHAASRFRVFATGGHAILDAHGPATLHDEILGFLQGKH